jgi:CRISPR-associated endonuclease/helicase Cas3
MVDDFATMFAKVAGPSPFPWQQRLFDRFRTGAIPDALDLPTGLGKTSVMACWLLAHAGAGGVARQLPRRLVYVVDRRAVVDQASAVAEGLAGAWPQLAWPRAPALRIATLRGQHLDRGDWLRHPQDLAIIVGTVDMIGSRLLFSGYGVAPGMRPVHAGLLGSDTLLVLDEAHLSPAFAALGLAASADPALRGAAAPPVPGLRFMSLSATQAGAAGFRDVLRLDGADLAHPVVRERLRARKRVERRQGAAERELVAAALDAAAGTARTVVFLDKRSTAETVAAALAKEAGPEAVLLFTGGRRMRERTQAAADLTRFGFLAGSVHDGRARFLVATSAAEVGVDLDADHAVMDLVAWERMVQRLGRVNRRGLGEARVILCDDGEAESRGADLAACRDLFGRIEDASPAALRHLAEAEPDRVRRATTPDPLRPPLCRAELDAWSLTGLRDHPGRAEVAPFLRGWVEEEAQLRLVWRRHLPLRPGAAEAAQERADFFEAAPVHLSEVLEVEIGRFRDWLKKRLKAGLPEADDRAPDSGMPVMLVLDGQGGVERLGSIGELQKRLADPRQAERFLDSVIGKTLVLDARLAGLSEAGTLDAGWNEAPLTADADADGDDDWAGLVGFSVAVEDPGDAAADRPDPLRLAFPLTAEEDGARLVVRGPVAAAGDGRGEARSRGVAVRLADHSANVRAAAARLAEALGLPGEARALLDLAARLHDQGKAARHWQRAMGAAALPGGPWAKTPRGDGRALAGYRHEFGSLLAAEEDPALRDLPEADRDLVLHLIAAHHGHARPFLAAHGGDRGPPSQMQRHAAAAALRFAALSRRWGPWGLAWWEAVLRAADWQASAQEPPGRGGADG